MDKSALVDRIDEGLGPAKEPEAAVTQLTVQGKEFYIGMEREVCQRAPLSPTGSEKLGTKKETIVERLVHIEVDIYFHVAMLCARLHWTASGENYYEDVVASMPWAFYLEGENETA